MAITAFFRFAIYHTSTNFEIKYTFVRSLEDSKKLTFFTFPLAFGSFMSPGFSRCLASCPAHHYQSELQGIFLFAYGILGGHCLFLQGFWFRDFFGTFVFQLCMHNAPEKVNLYQKYQLKSWRFYQFKELKDFVIQLNSPRDLSRRIWIQYNVIFKIVFNPIILNRPESKNVN